MLCSLRPFDQSFDEILHLLSMRCRTSRSNVDKRSRLIVDDSCFHGLDVVGVKWEALAAVVRFALVEDQQVLRTGWEMTKVWTAG